MAAAMSKWQSSSGNGLSPEKNFGKLLCCRPQRGRGLARTHPPHSRAALDDGDTCTISRALERNQGARRRGDGRAAAAALEAATRA
jgi:hypothetical protein